MEKRISIKEENNILVLDISSNLGNDDWLRTLCLMESDIDNTDEIQSRFDIPLYDYMEEDENTAEEIKD